MKTIPIKQLIDILKKECQTAPVTFAYDDSGDVGLVLCLGDQPCRVLITNNEMGLREVFDNPNGTNNKT